MASYTMTGGIVVGVGLVAFTATVTPGIVSREVLGGYVAVQRYMSPVRNEQGMLTAYAASGGGLPVFAPDPVYVPHPDDDTQMLAKPKRDGFMVGPSKSLAGISQDGSRSLEKVLAAKRRIAIVNSAMTQMMSGPRGLAAVDAVTSASSVIPATSSDPVFGAAERIGLSRNCAVLNAIRRSVPSSDMSLEDLDPLVQLMEISRSAAQHINRVLTDYQNILRNSGSWTIIRVAQLLLGDLKRIGLSQKDVDRLKIIAQCVKGGSLYEYVAGPYAETVREVGGLSLDGVVPLNLFSERPAKLMKGVMDAESKLDNWRQSLVARL